MKPLLTFLAAILLSSTSNVPEGLSYQAVIRDASNKIVANQSIGMQISILQGSASGTSVYTETQTTTSNANGMISIYIGEGQSSDDFNSINWAKGTYFLKTEADPTGGSNYTITGTSQLLSVPYAMHSKTSENGLDKISSDGDTLYLSNGNWIIIPGISLANTPSDNDETVEDKPDNFDVSTVLQNAADNIIIPQFNDLNESVTELESAYITFESSATSENLINFQEKFKNSYSLWQSCSFVNYGNTNLVSLGGTLNNYPTDTANINSIFTTPDANLEWAMYFDAIGFPGLDYVLFEGSEEEIIDRISNSGSLYCSKNIALIKTNVEEAYTFWKDDTDGFYSNFKTQTSKSVGSPFSSYVNGFVKNVEVLKNGQLGFPAGKFTLNYPQPDQSEALYSGISLQLYKEHLANLERIYRGQDLNGTDGLGLDDYLNYLGTTREVNGETENLNELILDVFSTLKEKSDLLTGTMNEAIGSQKEITDELYQKTKELVAYLKVDMTYAFDIQITYIESDGD